MLAGDKFITWNVFNRTLVYICCLWTLTENKERLQPFTESKDSRDIYQNELDKTCFQNNMPYGGFPDFPRRTAPDNVSHDKAFNIAKSRKYDGYKGSLAYKI